MDPSRHSQSLRHSLNDVTRLAQKLASDAEQAQKYLERQRLGIVFITDGEPDYSDLIDLQQRVEQTLAEFFSSVDASKQLLREMPHSAISRLSDVCTGWKDRVAMAIRKIESPFFWMRPNPVEIDSSQFYGAGFVGWLQTTNGQLQVLNELAEWLDVFALETIVPAVAVHSTDAPKQKTTTTSEEAARLLKGFEVDDATTPMMSLRTLADKVLVANRKDTCSLATIKKAFKLNNWQTTTKGKPAEKRRTRGGNALAGATSKPAENISEADAQAEIRRLLPDGDERDQLLAKLIEGEIPPAHAVNVAEMAREQPECSRTAKPRKNK